jgi:hypothetical protein
MCCQQADLLRSAIALIEKPTYGAASTGRCFSYPKRSERNRLRFGDVTDYNDTPRLMVQANRTLAESILR